MILKNNKTGEYLEYRNAPAPFFWECARARGGLHFIQDDIKYNVDDWDMVSIKANTEYHKWLKQQRQMEDDRWEKRHTEDAGFINYGFKDKGGY